MRLSRPRTRSEGACTRIQGPPLPRYFQQLWQHCGSLSDDNYLVTDGLDDAELEAELRAAVFVLRGAHLHKYRKSGREKPAIKFMNVESWAEAPGARRSRAQLQWDKKVSVCHAAVQYLCPLSMSRSHVDAGPCAGR